MVFWIFSMTGEKQKNNNWGSKKNFTSNQNYTASRLQNHLKHPQKSPCYESQDVQEVFPKQHILCSSAHWKHRPIWKTIVLDISGGAFASPSLETCALQTRTICPEWLYLSKMRNRGVLEPTGMLVPSGQVQSYVFILKASEIPLSMHREESEAFWGERKESKCAEELDF